MKRAASLKSKTVIPLLALLFSLLPGAAFAASGSFITIDIAYGRAQYREYNFGQTFTVPVGMAGTLSSIDFSVLSYFNTVDDVLTFKLWDSPSKTTLLGTSSTTITLAPSPTSFGPVTPVSAQFSGINLVNGGTYYFELIQTAGDQGIYLLEDNITTYAGGDVYHNGVIDPNYDAALRINMINLIAQPVAITLGLTSGSKQATYRTVSQIRANLSGESKVTFYANGHVIAGCRRIPSSSLIARCDWKPSLHGAVTISAVAAPIDPVNFSKGAVATQSIGVIKRSNQR